MSITIQLRNHALKLRKERNPIAASITFVISEIEKVGKNNGNRETTNEEAIKVVQKIISTLKDNLKYAMNSSGEILINEQITILESVLPSMISETEIREHILALYEEPTFIVNKGNVMRSFKDSYGVLVDLKLVGKILQEYT